MATTVTQQHSDLQLFQSASDFRIHGGEFYQAQTINVQRKNATKLEPGFEILLKNTAPGAFHNSKDRFDPPKCHPETRIAVLKRITTWADDPDHSKKIMWLYGPAGAGKSAIAQSIAEELDKEKKLAASFFFSRTDSAAGRDSAERLVATIVYQVALALPRTRTFIGETIMLDPTIFSRSLETQVQRLLVDTLISSGFSEDDKAKLIAIDGLDECGDAKVQDSILRIISAALRQHNLPLRFLVTSRPEPPILRKFNENELLEITDRLVLDDSYKPNEDIEKFLKSEFADLKQTHILRKYLPDDWPSEQQIQALVQRSSGQFIYAATVMNYIKNPEQHPDAQLDVILGISSPPNGDTPFAQLDALYAHILSSAYNHKVTLRVLSVVLIAGLQPQNTNILRCIDHLLALKQGATDLALAHLHSVLHIPKEDEDNGRLTLYHKSFSDYLLDRARSRNSFIDTLQVHEDLAKCCINYCSSHVLKWDVDILAHSTTHFLRHLSHLNIEQAKAIINGIDPLKFITHLIQRSRDVSSYNKETVAIIEGFIVAGITSKEVHNCEDPKLYDILDKFHVAFAQYHICALAKYPQGTDLSLFITITTYLPYHDPSGNESIILNVLDMEDKTMSALRDADQAGLRLEWGNRLDRSYLVWLQGFFQSSGAAKYYVDGCAYGKLALRLLNHFLSDTNYDAKWLFYQRTIIEMFVFVSKASPLDSELASFLRQMDFDSEKVTKLLASENGLSTRAKHIVRAYLRNYEEAQYDVVRRLELLDNSHTSKCCVIA